MKAGGRWLETSQKRFTPGSGRALEVQRFDCSDRVWNLGAWCMHLRCPKAHPSDLQTTGSGLIFRVYQPDEMVLCPVVWRFCFW